jgi:hypothetical protein
MSQHKHAIDAAAEALDVPVDELTAWLMARAPRTSAPYLVSEDDYRGVAADLIARWADDHVDAATVLGSLNLAAHGMPVTTPSRRALAKIRDLVVRAYDMGTDVRPSDLVAILDEVGA